MEERESQTEPEAGAASRRWSVVSLDELCEITSGITKGRKPPVEPLREVPYMAVINVQDGRLNLETVKTILASSSEIERYQLLPGDLLLTEGGDPDKLGRGTVWNAEIEVCIHQNHIFKVRAASPFIDIGYLSRLVASPDGKAYFLSKAKQTTGIASINLTQLRSFPVHFPPLNEQRRIAAKLDTTLAAVEACRQRLDGVAAILKRFRQAVLAAATSGELTREWREERGGTIDSWSKKIIADVSDQVFDGPFGSNLKSDDYIAQGARVVRLENISHLRFIEEKRTYVSREKFALLQKHVLFEDDILFSSFVDEEVRTCLLPAELSGGSINKADCFCIRANRDICLPGFVVSVLSCRSTFESFDGLVHGATRPRINLKQLKSIAINFPPIGEQLEILKRQDDLFSLADQLEARLTTARKIADRLTPALLAKAFRGELVPQDPGDEPASVLLERIRAARQVEVAAGKPSRRGRRKAATNPDQIAMEAAPVSADFLAGLLRECGALSERALLAVSELEPQRFQQQLYRELESGTAREVQENGQVLLEAVG